MKTLSYFILCTALVMIVSSCGFTDSPIDDPEAKHYTVDVSPSQYTAYQCYMSYNSSFEMYVTFGLTQIIGFPADDNDITCRNVRDYDVSRFFTCEFEFNGRDEEGNIIPFIECELAEQEDGSYHLNCVSTETINVCNLVLEVSEVADGAS